MSRGGRGRGRGGTSQGGNPAFGQFGSLASGDLNLLQELGMGLSATPNSSRKSIFFSEDNLQFSKEDISRTSDYRTLLRAMVDSPSYLRPPPPPRDIERYSDKYISASLDKGHNDSLTHITTSLEYFPSELHSVVDRTRARRVKAVKVDILKQLNKISEEADKVKAEESSEAEEEDMEDIYDEDDELDGDYGDNYFDPGENDYEDVDDEPTY